METVALRFYDYGCNIPQCVIYWKLLLQRQKIVSVNLIYGRTKLKLDNENYRDEKYMTLTAWMKSTNEN